MWDISGGCGDTRDVPHLTIVPLNAFSWCWVLRKWGPQSRSLINRFPESMTMLLSVIRNGVESWEGGFLNWPRALTVWWAPHVLGWPAKAQVSSVFSHGFQPLVYNLEQLKYLTSVPSLVKETYISLLLSFVPGLETVNCKALCK